MSRAQFTVAISTDEEAAASKSMVIYAFSAQINLFTSICMVHLMEIPRVIVFFSYYMIALLRFFQKRSFVLSSEHENQIVATIGTLLDQFMLSCK